MFNTHKKSQTQRGPVRPSCPFFSPLLSETVGLFWQLPLSTRSSCFNDRGPAGVFVHIYALPEARTLILTYRGSVTAWLRAGMFSLLCRCLMGHLCFWKTFRGFKVGYLKVGYFYFTVIQLTDGISEELTRVQYYIQERLSWFTRI